jgi:hypothetical protein
MPREQVILEKEMFVVAMFNKAKPLVMSVISVAGIYILWILLHFVSAHLYIYYCAHMSLMGAVMSPISVSAPHCRALRWAINTGANSIDAMWVVLGTWLCSKLVILGASTVAAAASKD